MADAEYKPCEISFFFGDDDYLFRLPLKQIAELEEKCGGYDHGGALGSIYRRVFTGEYRIADCVETIRLGLIGGGMDAIKARKMVDRHCEAAPKQFLWKNAMAILGACCQGYEPDEDVKKKDPSTMDGSASETPTAIVP